ncbi:MAG: hypothetical protein KDJ36_03855 [Hyphomicrobiaceae bacterium]|nr:hypothetical protein [Hyphomicrobiaceae bacterium]
MVSALVDAIVAMVAVALAVIALADMAHEAMAAIGLAETVRGGTEATVAAVLTGVTIAADLIADSVEGTVAVTRSAAGVDRGPRRASANTAAAAMSAGNRVAPENAANSGGGSALENKRPRAERPVRPSRHGVGRYCRRGDAQRRLPNAANACGNEGQPIKPVAGLRD